MRVLYTVVRISLRTLGGYVNLTRTTVRVPPHFSKRRVFLFHTCVVLCKLFALLILVFFFHRTDFFFVAL